MLAASSTGLILAMGPWLLCSGPAQPMVNHHHSGLPHAGDHCDGDQRMLEIQNLEPGTAVVNQLYLLSLGTLFLPWTYLTFPAVVPCHAFISEPCLIRLLILLHILTDRGHSTLYPCLW